MLNPVLYENQAIAEFAREIASKHNLALIPNGEGYVKNVNFCAYKLTPDQDANSVAALLRLKYPDKVKYVEYNGIVQLAYYPNDPFYMDGSMWGLYTIQTDLAWDITIGDSNQWIAVIDTGIYTDPDVPTAHEDLYNWGYYEEQQYWTDLYRGDKIPDDENGHGTNVAGTIAAVGDNDTGVVGIAYSSNILPIKVLGPDGRGDNAHIASAILLADVVGCLIINMSLGASYPNRTVAENCAKAFADGVVIVAAAGNENTGLPNYPGSYPEVINVGAAINTDNRASYSSYGLTVDIVAPGGANIGTDPADEILTTGRNSANYYETFCGTSAASPHVAGVAALKRASEPTATPLEVRYLIECYGDDVLTQSEWQSAVTLKRLNAYTPLLYTVTDLPTIIVTSHSDNDEIFGDVDIEVNVSAPSAVAGVHYYIDGQYIDWNDTSPYTFSFNTEDYYLPPGEHTFTFEVLTTDNAHGYDSVVLNVVDSSLNSPYWTGFEDTVEQEGWWAINYSNANSYWQYDAVSGNTLVYFGDTNKPGGRGYYADDVDVLGSPSVDLTGLQSPTLYLTSKWDMDTYDQIVLAVTSSGFEDYLYFWGQNSEWPALGTYQMDLSDFAGSKCSLDFWTDLYESSSGGPGFWLDNVVISDSAAPPSVTIVSPTPAANSLVQGWVTLNASVTDDNGIVLGSQYKIGASVVRTFSGAPAQFAWNSASVTDGNRTFTATADDELSKYGYDTQGSGQRTFYVHNTAPSGIAIDPPSALIGDEVTITGAHFGKTFDGQTFVYFAGSSVEMEAIVSSWTDTSITCTVPSGAVTGAVRVQIGVKSGVSSLDFIVDPFISDFRFTSPADGIFLEDPADFTLSSQPLADSIEFEVVGRPEITIPDDTTPDAIQVTLSPLNFTRNGEYTLKATAYAPGEQATAQISFFVEKLIGDFNGDGVVNSSDLTILLGSIWAEPGDANWIPYLDTNRNGIIEEDDAAIVGYNFGDT
jgi:subtilisin family serine protease